MQEMSSSDMIPRGEANSIITFGIEAQHLSDPVRNREAVLELFDSLPTSDAEPIPHIRIITSDSPRIGERVKAAAMQLHTDVYLKKGIITDDQLNNEGLYVDEYAVRSKYYVVRNGQKVAAARQISCDRYNGILSLPTLTHFSVDPDKLASIAGAQSVVDIKPKETVEISGLASERLEGGVATGFDAIIALYSSMLRTSLEGGHKLWVMNVEPAFIRRLQFMVGHDQVHILGKERVYQGEPTVPIGINPQEVVRQVLTTSADSSSRQKTYMAHMRAVLEGVNDRKIPSDIQELLAAQDIRVNRYSKVAKFATDPQVIVQAAMMGYSACRAFPAGNVHQFEGSTWGLWGIDVATSIPYVYGMSKMYTAPTIGGKALGATIAIPTFLAPYAYFYLEGGKDFPPYVNAAVAAFIGSAVVKEVVMRKRRNSKERRLRDDLQHLDNDPMK